MRRVVVPLAALVALAGAGCSGDPPIKPEDKPRVVRQMVISSVRLAREQPGRIVERAALYVEKLQQVKGENLDDNGPVYDELIKRYQELSEAAKRSPTSAEVNKKLGELSELAKKLPM